MCTDCTAAALLHKWFVTFVASLTATGKKHDFDLIVIGGGSGGLAASKEAVSYGKKVAVCDFVVPSHRGTKWGIGGTCVNVGCIPKKLMHQAALLKEGMHDAPSFGWEIEPEKVTMNWQTLVDNVQNHIKSLNFGYRSQLRDKGVTYFNEFASFIDKNTILTKNAKGVESVRTADNFLIAVGGRPELPIIPGIEHAITSDDIFSLKESPGKTLVVGASYVALECAGFLNRFGYDTSVMVRSIVLRGFDSEMAQLIQNNMEHDGVKFIRPAVPEKIEKLDDGSLDVYFTQKGVSIKQNFKTVLFAIGRRAITNKLNLNNIMLKTVDKDKIRVDAEERTSVDNIFAIGDCAEGRPELTPTAIMAGKLLARRLYSGKYKSFPSPSPSSSSSSPSPLIMNYKNVATTVFTPLEYGCVGLSEDDALSQYGKDKIEVFHSYFQPLEFTVPHRPENQCFAKIICLKNTSQKTSENKSDEEDFDVLGIHICGPHAGEIIQGFAVAFKKGLKKSDLDSTVGIHPTVAEELTGVTITKSSGLDPKKSGC